MVAIADVPAGTGAPVSPLGVASQSIAVPTNLLTTATSLGLAPAQELGVPVTTYEAFAELLASHRPESRAASVPCLSG